MLILFQQLFTLFLIILLMTQTPKSNWLTKKLYDTGYFGSYRNVQRMLFAATIGSVFLFFASIYHARTPAPDAASGRRADVAHESPNNKPNGVWDGGTSDRDNGKSLKEQDTRNKDGLKNQENKNQSDDQD
jgi:hypothetical protein